MNLDSLSDEKFESLLQPLWDFLLANDAPEKGDAIFVFGGVDLHVPDQAAKLYSAGFAPTVLVSGNSGLYTVDHFTGTEADVFAARMIEQGIPSGAIIKEVAATNTGLNVAYGMKELEQGLGYQPSRLLIVARSFLTRRCKATFAQQFPGLEVVGCSPNGKILDFVVSTRLKFAMRLAAEVDRLDSYANQGFTVPVDVPADVRQIVSELSSVKAHL